MLRRVEGSTDRAGTFTPVGLSIPYGVAWSLGKRLFMGRINVRVRVHEAVLESPYRTDAFFINVTNLSPGRRVQPTHVTVMTTPPLAVVNPMRPLRRLEPDGDSWETWVEKGALPDPSLDIRGLVQVRLSTGKTIMSVPATPGVDVPVAGEVPR